MEPKQKTKSVFRRKAGDGFLNPLAVKLRNVQRENKKLREQLKAKGVTL